MQLENQMVTVNYKQEELC